MKKLTIATLMSVLALPIAALAEGKANHDWAEEAAVKYEKKAEMASKHGDEKSAKIYLRMAQIKRDAGAANKAGKEFSWDEYHALNAKLNSGHAKHDKHEKHHKVDKKHHDKRKADHGDGFLKAAADYEKKGMMAIKHGDADKAQIYLQMAEIKRQASVAAKAGKDFDWSRYEQLQKKLHGEAGKEHQKHEKHHKVHSEEKDFPHGLNVE